MTTDSKLTRIGVFYDGNYFAHVSNFYNYEHHRRARLSISGIHDFVRHYVAEAEAVDVSYCHVVDAHYFRGRINSYELDDHNRLLSERIFDDILMSEGVITHYMALKSVEGRKEEKGIDVLLALEALEGAFLKQFNVLVLIACDGDYIPLVRKINALGTRVMVLAWDFEYTDERTNRLRKTTTSPELLKECTYPVNMHDLVESHSESLDPIIEGLFVQKDLKPIPKPKDDLGEEMLGNIHSIKDGYGFIHMPPNNLFFHYSSLLNVEIKDLKENDEVEFRIGRNERGQEIAVEVKKVMETEPFSMEM